MSESLDSNYARSGFNKRLTPAAGETLITKQHASAFFATSLASALTSLRVDTVLIAGETMAAG